MSYLSNFFRTKNAIDNQDLYKFLAFLTMVIDHIGLYFFPEHMWLRAIGRGSALIWFFYLGYNYKEKPIINDKIFYACLILATFKYSFYFVPNIFISMLLIKMILKKFKGFTGDEWIGFSITSFFFYFLTKHFFEYGTLGIFIGLWGFSEKHKLHNNIIPLVCCLVQYILTQLISFNFNVLEATLAFLSILISFAMLYKFKPHILRINSFSKFIISFFSRHSLYLYCLHLIVFALIKIYL